MSTYLEKHFNRNLKGEETEAILEDYPMPNCPALKVPRLDEEFKKQLRTKERSPFWTEDIIQYPGGAPLGQKPTHLLMGRHD